MILCALLPQLLLALFAPALVVCEEANGDQALELSFTPCCATDTAASSATAQVRGLEDGCGGCEDEALLVSLQREDEQASCDFTPHLQAAALSTTSWAPVAQPTRVATSGPPGCARLAAIRTVVFRC